MCTCGSQFECFGGRPPTGWAFGWNVGIARWGSDPGPLDDGRSVMEHPVWALIHLACSPVPSEPEAAFELL